MERLLVFVFAAALSCVAVSAATYCDRFANCTAHCVHKEELLDNAKENDGQLTWSILVQSMGPARQAAKCAAKCNNLCQHCKPCRYLRNQMVKKLSGIPTEGKCEKLEQCDGFGAKNSTHAIADSCIRHCFDCRQCKFLSRKWFVKVCRMNNLESELGFKRDCVQKYKQMVRNV